MSGPARAFARRRVPYAVRFIEARVEHLRESPRSSTDCPEAGFETRLTE